MRNTKFWTEADIKFLKDNFDKDKLNELASIMGRSFESVYGKAKKLGLHSKEKIIKKVEGEIWKKIDIASNYSISNFGRARSDLTNKRIAQTEREGYFRIKISNNEGVRVSLSVNILVASAFVKNTNPKIYIEVNHIDGNKANNHFKNLEWVNHGQNMQHAYDNGLRDRLKTTGEKNPMTVLNENLVQKICKLLEKGIPIKQIQINLNIENLSYACLGNIKNRKNWVAISSKYKF